MCDKASEAKVPREFHNQIISGTPLGAAESNMVYELKQKREYLLRQIVIVQQAIDAVNLASNF